MTEDAKFHHQEFIRVLREESVHKDDPIPEWEVDGVLDGDGKCICTKELKRVFLIRNKITEKQLPVGCDCIKRWDIQHVMSCNNCGSALGNKLKREKEKDYICTTCKKEEKKQEAARTKFLNDLISAKGKWICYIRGPCYNKSYKEVFSNTNFLDYIVNQVPAQDNKTYKLFKSLLYAHIELGLLEVKDEE